MPPRLFFVRHGEAEHNVRKGKFHDSWLTETGQKQCLNLRDTFAHHNDISLVVSSPLRRAIQTAAYSFSPALRNEDVPFVLLPEAQELAANSCDIGHDREELERQILEEELFDAEEVGFGVEKVDLRNVVEGWNSKKGEWGTGKRVYEGRAARLRTWLYKRQEECIVVVTHGGFLHALTEDWTDFGKYRGTGWANCEIKEFRFTDKSVAADAHVELTGSSPFVTKREKNDPAVGLKKEKSKSRTLFLADAVRWTLEAVEKEEAAKLKAAAPTADEVEKTTDVVEKTTTTTDETKKTKTTKGKEKAKPKITKPADRIEKPVKAAEEKKKPRTGTIFIADMIRDAVEKYEKEVAEKAAAAAAAASKPAAATPEPDEPEVKIEETEKKAGRPRRKAIIPMKRGRPMRRWKPKKKAAEPEKQDTSSENGFHHPARPGCCVV